MLISEAYRAEQAALHAKGNYGTMGAHYAGTILQLLNSTGARSLLDYGCGSRRSLLQTLTLPPEVVYEGYDPAVPEYAEAPLPAEVVSCIDVLEHIEPSLLDNVLSHLGELCDPLGFFTIHSGPAAKVLSDGRNAHLTQEGPDWWLPRLKKHFEVLQVENIPSGFAVLVRSLASDTQLNPPKLRLPFAAAGGNAPATAPATESPSQLKLSHEGIEMIFNTPNQMTAWRVKTIYEKEPDTIRWIAGMVPGSVLLDVGANVGMYSIFASKTRKMKVFAFEPESQNYALLNANIAANQLSGQVAAFPLALSDTMKLDRLFLSDFSTGGSCHSFGEEVGFDLKPRGAAFAQGSFSATIDQLVESGSMPVPDYIKLDVDGFEHKVLAGAAKTLQDPKVIGILVELNTHLPEHRSAVENLESLGFTYDAAQAQGALRKSGAFEGVGEFIFRRGAPKSEGRVDFSKRFSVTPPPTTRGRQVLRHLTRQVAQAELITTPYPYIVVDEIFPPDYYAEMLAHFPTEESLRPITETGRVTGKAYDDRLVVLFTDEDFARMNGMQQAFWREFSSWMYSDLFINAFMLKFQEAIEPRLENILKEDQALKIRGDALLVNDRTNYAIGPHTDAPHRLVSFLFYLPKDDSLREFGTSIYRAKDPKFTCWGGLHHGFEDFERVKTVDFLPNRLVAFPKTERCFHGVEPIKQTGVSRPLLINNIRLLNKLSR